MHVSVSSVCSQQCRWARTREQQIEQLLSTKALGAILCWLQRLEQ